MPLLPAAPEAPALAPCVSHKATLKRSRAGVLTVKLPPDVARTLGVDTGTVPSLYYALTNGVVQLSVREPKLSIPVGDLDEGAFTKQGQGD